MTETADVPALTLSPTIDVAALAHAFARDGRVQIAPFLDPAAAQYLAHHLNARDDWRQVINSGDKVFETQPALLATLSDTQRARLEAAMYQSARTGFQYRYHSIRVPDDDAQRTARGTALDRFSQMMTSDPVQALFRQITGAQDIIHADAQATLYRPGDFLTGHNDDTPGTHRRAAYVFGLTPAWRTEWGGLLLFHRPDGSICEGFVPAFNTISLFSVPQLHSVSLVAPWVEAPRLSITGWLRAGKDAG